VLEGRLPCTGLALQLVGAQCMGCKWCRNAIVFSPQACTGLAVVLRMPVAEDGTLRRITNWASLSQQEKVVALRRIAQRNQASAAWLGRHGSSWPGLASLVQTIRACNYALRACYMRQHAPCGSAPM
jgi:predicted Fe-S protein YdhL (DUF1289 family)